MGITKAINSERIHIMKINFGDLLFTVDEEGKLFFDKCFFADNSQKKSALQMTPAYDFAGGATSGTVNLVSPDAAALLRYVKHEISEDTLSIVQACDGVEITSVYRRYTDTNAIRVTQTVKNTGSAPRSLELLNTVNLTFGDYIYEHRDWYLHRFTNYR